jgi:hypothetical protein
VALTLLLVTVQVVARLHRSSFVAAASVDAVHRAARADVGARAEAESDLRRALGPRAEVRWSAGPDGVRVEVVVDAPDVPGLAPDIRRGATARWERQR